MTLPVAPLGTPFFITEHGYQSDGFEYLSENIAVTHGRFGLNPVLVPVLARTHVRQPLMSHHATLAVVADAENLCACAHRPIRRVKKHVAFKFARRLQPESGFLKPLRQFCCVVYTEFDFGLNRHSQEVSIRQRTSDNRSVTTLRLSVDPAHLDDPESRRVIAQAADILRKGGLVAFPTETVYGLGANALDAAAVARIFEAKQRPSWDPIIVHIAGPVAENPMLETLVTAISGPTRGLILDFWPGPLTLLLPRSATVPDAVTAGRPLVGVRMPAHPVAFELIEQAGVPIAAPSANVFGHISPTSAAHVLDDLDGRIDAVLDAGPTLHGVESTVLDPNQSPMMIYRPGAITAAQIRDVAGPVVFYTPAPTLPATPESPLPSPGVGIRHYAPHARLVLVDGPLATLASRIAEEAARHASERLGFLLPVEISPSALLESHPTARVFSWGHWDAPEELAHNLYAGLRSLDAHGCSVIVCPLPPAEGLGSAMRDRLFKAAR